MDLSEVRSFISHYDLSLSSETIWLVSWVSDSFFSVSLAQVPVVKCLYDFWEMRGLKFILNLFAYKFKNFNSLQQGHIIVLLWAVTQGTRQYLAKHWNTGTRKRSNFGGVGSTFLPSKTIAAANVLSVSLRCFVCMYVLTWIDCKLMVTRPTSDPW